MVIYILHYGWTSEELVVRFPFLSLAHIHDALAYYYDNQEEIEKDLAENSEDPIHMVMSTPSS